MNRKLTTIIIFVTLAAASAAAAPMTLDRDSAVELALENNPDFIIEGISLETAEREDRTSWNRFLPGLSAGVGLNGGSNLLDSQPNDMAWSLNASLNLSLPLNPSLAWEIRGLQLAYESQEISYESARQSLVAAVEKEFYYLLAVEKNLDIEEANIVLAAERYEQTLLRYENGLAGELEMLQARVTAANLEPAYLQTLADFGQRVREFLIVLGLDPETKVALSGTLEAPVSDFDAEQLVLAYLNGRTDIQAYRLALEIAENNRTEAAVGTRSPSLNLSSGWNTNVGDPFNAGSWNYDTWTDGWSLGLSLSIPLDTWIPGSSDSVAIQGRKDDVEIASVGLAGAVEEARTEIINLVAQLETSAANMQLTELNVELAQKTYELSELSYERGTIQRLDVEDAQQSYLEAVQQGLVSRYEYLAGLIDLRVALGLDSLEGLI